MSIRIRQCISIWRNRLLRIFSLVLCSMLGKLVYMRIGGILLMGGLDVDWLLLSFRLIIMMCLVGIRLAGTNSNPYYKYSLYKTY